MQGRISRRHLLWSAGGISGLLLLGGGSAAVIAAESAAPKLTMYRSSGCGCCLKWVAAAQKAGFQVTVVNSPDIRAVKEKHGVPQKLYACHTTLAGGYVVEGHVPFDAIRTLLRRKPAIKGIAVPGMPMGSPGMETPSGDKEPFQVMAFDSAGKISAFA